MNFSRYDNLIAVSWISGPSSCLIGLVLDTEGNRLDEEEITYIAKEWGQSANPAKRGISNGIRELSRQGIAVPRAVLIRYDDRCKRADVFERLTIRLVDQYSHNRRFVENRRLDLDALPMLTPPYRRNPGV